MQISAGLINMSESTISIHYNFNILRARYANQLFSVSSAHTECFYWFPAAAKVVLKPPPAAIIFVCFSSRMSLRAAHNESALSPPSVIKELKYFPHESQQSEIYYCRGLPSCSYYFIAAGKESFHSNNARVHSQEKALRTHTDLENFITHLSLSPRI